MKLTHALWIPGVLALAAAGIVSVRGEAQTMVCTTTTRTTTDYESNGVIITWTESIRVCRPMA